jgi:trans-aconitate 2-methyltransferase
VAATPEWAPLSRRVLRGADSTDSAQDYAEMLIAVGLSVDAWETTYVHVLPGEDAVLGWVRGTALRPVLDALDDEQGVRFAAEYAALLRAAYPPTAAGTLFPFRRVFVVGRKP